MQKSTNSESKQERNFSKYQIALVEWNDVIGKLHKVRKLPDNVTNRIRHQVVADELSVAYSRYKKMQSQLNFAILEQHNKKPNWRSAAKEMEN